MNANGCVERMRLWQPISRGVAHKADTTRVLCARAVLLQDKQTPARRLANQALAKLYKLYPRDEASDRGVGTAAAAAGRAAVDFPMYASSSGSVTAVDTSTGPSESLAAATNPAEGAMKHGATHDAMRAVGRVAVAEVTVRCCVLNLPWRCGSPHTHAALGSARRVCMCVSS